MISNKKISDLNEHIANAIKLSAVGAASASASDVIMIVQGLVYPRNGMFPSNVDGMIRIKAGERQDKIAELEQQYKEAKTDKEVASITKAIKNQETRELTTIGLKAAKEWLSQNKQLGI
jgi:hypothetical protein